MVMLVASSIRICYTREMMYIVFLGQVEERRMPQSLLVHTARFCERACKDKHSPLEK